MMDKLHRPRLGISRVDLIFILVVILMLIVLGVPAVEQAREAARRSQCKNNLKQVGLALANYHDVHNALPMGWTQGHPTDPTNADSWAWGVHIAPYLESSPLYAQLMTRDYPPASGTKLDAEYLTFRCPTDAAPEFNPAYAGYSKSNYVGVHGAGVREVSDNYVQQGNGAFSEASSVSLADVEGGAANTFFMGERAGTYDGTGAAIWMRSINQAGDGDDGTAVAGVCSQWAKLNDMNKPDAFASWHTGGGHFLMGDGAVRFVNEDIDLQTYEQLATIADD